MKKITATDILRKNIKDLQMLFYLYPKATTKKVISMGGYSYGAFRALKARDKDFRKKIEWVNTPAGKRAMNERLRRKYKKANIVVVEYEMKKATSTKFEGFMLSLITGVVVVATVVGAVALLTR